MTASFKRVAFIHVAREPARSQVQILRPPLATVRTAHAADRPRIAERSVIARCQLPELWRQQPMPAQRNQWDGFQTDAYVDYERFLTPEGGVVICYKDLDQRLRHTLWRLLAWSASTGIAGWFVFYRPPLENIWINIALLIAMAIVNWLIVRRPVETYSMIEVRPDCIILNEKDVFWQRFMEAWPSLQPDREDNQILCGIYGTRFLEYATLRRFDEFDRMPEVFAMHFEEAMKQLWLRPYH